MAGLVLAFVSASALLPASPAAVHFSSPAAARSATPRLNLDQEFSESVKVSAISALSGSLAAAPILSPHLKGATEMQFTFGMLAPELALFGVCYRCIVREDTFNKPLKWGAVGAAALCRAFASMPMTKEWTGETTGHLMGSIGEGAIIFYLAATAIDYAYRNGLAYPLEGRSQTLQEGSDYGYDQNNGYNNGYGQNNGYGGYGNNNQQNNNWNNNGGMGGGMNGGMNGGMGGGMNGGMGGGMNRGMGGMGGQQGNFGGQQQGNFGGQQQGNFGGQQGNFGGQQGNFGGQQRGVVTPTNGMGNGRGMGGGQQGGSTYEEYMRNRQY